MDTINNLREYLNEIAKIPLLSKEEEVELAEARDVDALVQHNLRLVISIAKRYKGKGLSFMDLIQEGNIGLMKAAEKYDATLGFRFSTYATYWIKQALGRALINQSRNIRIPVHMVSEVNKLKNEIRKYEMENNDSISNEELAKRVGKSKQEVDELLKIDMNTVSLNSIVGDEEDAELGDFIADEEGITPYGSAENNMLSKSLNEILDTIDSREAKVIRMRFGLGGQEPKTLDEVGKVLGVTKERIRQIEDKALRKLRNPMRSATLKEYLD